MMRSRQARRTPAADPTRTSVPESADHTCAPALTPAPPPAPTTAPAPTSASAPTPPADSAPKPPAKSTPTPNKHDFGLSDFRITHIGLSGFRLSQIRNSRFRVSRLRISAIAGEHGWAGVAGLGLGLLALGPALGRGFALSYDMVFVPRPPIGAADLGFGGEPARAVPSDLTVALVAKIIPAELVQKTILIALFVLACAGAAALLAAGWRQVKGDDDVLTLLPRLVAGVCYAWNPFVAERLIMGQWALLLGYAGLPWVLREVGSRSGPIKVGRLALAMVPGLIGGFAAMSITALAAVPVAACGPGLARADRGRRVGVTLAVLAVASLPWLIPSAVMAVHADPAGAAAFAARADTPFGTAGSLLMLGGMWNAQAVPAGYGSLASTCWLLIVVAAIAGYVVAARPRQGFAGLGVAAVIGFGIAALGSWSATLSVLESAISFFPGFALLRDGQQFIAPLALAESIGLGAGVAALIAIAGSARSGRSRRPGNSVSPAAIGATVKGAGGTSSGGPASGAAVMIGVIALVAPVVLLPGLAWGAVGRLRAVEYPADWTTARHLIDTSRSSGSVLLLPWAQYRRYPWNHGEPLFDPWPKLLGRSMIWNDALQVGPTTITAESGAARRLGPLIDSTRPLTTAMRSAGVRFVIVDAGPLLGRPRDRLADLARLPGAQVVMASADLVVFRLPG